MGKALFVTEKPSVAQDYVKVLNIKATRKDGYLEGDKAVFTWCVGHLVTMSYPEVYDEKLKRWTLDTLPFLPTEYKYEVIPAVAKQFNIVKALLNREDIDTVYVCTDSGREGEYIFRLVDQMAGETGKEKKRVWIDSQTEEEVKRGIKEAKPLEEYDALSAAAYLRAKEDYLQGINFSRLLTLIYGSTLSQHLKEKSTVIAVGRVMSCVLGMVVDREREVREFIKDYFYRIAGSFSLMGGGDITAEWKVTEDSSHFGSELLYSENGFKKKEAAEEFINKIDLKIAIIKNVNKTKEKKNPPLLYNLAELQNECSKMFKISPEETLNNVQSLYEKKMMTYPRTDARVLSKAVSKEISKNINGLLKHPNEAIKNISREILEEEKYKGIEKSKYVDDSKITDHYAIVPTGAGLENYEGLKPLEQKIFDLVTRRFLSVFYPAAEYSKVILELKVGEESFFASSKVLVEEGYLKVVNSYKEEEKPKDGEPQNEKEKEEKLPKEVLEKLKKGMPVQINEIKIKEGETSPPKRYTTGSIILAMENAGKLIEDEELREHIKSSGIGTSATRAEILKKLERIDYTSSNKKTQILTPTIRGELIFDVIKDSVPSLLNPALTASWEKGLGLVATKEITEDEFMNKLKEHINNNVNKVLHKGRIIDSKRIFKKAADNNNFEISEEDTTVLGVCPICKSGMIRKNKSGFGCTNWQSGCGFFVGKIAGVQVDIHQVKLLIAKGKTDVINGFKSKEGKEFNSRLEIRDKKISFLFN